MSVLDRIRSRRKVARHNRAIERALQAANHSPAIRDEIVAIAQRFYG